VFTPTEAGVVAVVYAFFVSLFIYKELKLKELPRLFVATARNTAIVMLVCGSALAAGYYITIAQIPAMLSETLLALAGDNKYILMLVINILLLLVGCVLDLTPALLIMGPMLLPIVTKFGIDPVYFGCVMVVNLCIGLITPPVGMSMFISCTIAKIKITDFAREIPIFIVALIGVLLVITYLPETVLFLPQLIMGK